MANPTLLTMPLCVNADKNTIPPTDAGTSGLFSEELGWQEINSLPLASGGKAPNRRDFNGVFALLGGIAYACQRGYTFTWDSTQDYEVGCVVIDSTDGKRYECISDVSANVTPPISDTTHWQEFKTGGGGTPIGIIEAFAGNGQIPEGYLLCDGSAVSRTMFPDLFDVIGTIYGSGDGSTTFNLPDSNQAKRFLQGDTVAGTVKQDGLPNIKGTLVPGRIVGAYLSSTNGALAWTGGANNRGLTVATGATNEGALSFDASQSNAIYSDSVTTVQPNALTTRYIIKAFDGQTPDSALIDITQYANELAGKADRDLDNLSAVGEAKIQTLSPRYLVDSYYDDTTGNWYRVYDDGWVEQGGLVSGTPSSGYINTTISLLKPMQDNKYNVNLQGYFPSSTGTSNYINTVKTTSFYVAYLLASATNTARWRVEGMGASV